ncbi:MULTISPECIES: helix-turn-helix domain-containing protein [unclassified Variovorax]|uniref:helix-turn-helix domain-containing protein n=1 Tax=unclassified Variovorax TaxID=663243 RepID=UPI001F4DE6A4|nr:helix-turn-helix domain-containing protein [Variovorax sp. B2]
MHDLPFNGCVAGWKRLTGRWREFDQVGPAWLTGSSGRVRFRLLHRSLSRLAEKRADGALLNCALVDLPRCEDITELALDLGFSSHAHFSNAFKAHFGIAPSIFRDRATNRSRVW